MRVLWVVILRGCFLFSEVKLFSSPSELSAALNVTLFPFCYFSGKYCICCLLPLLDQKLRSRKRCWKQLVIFFYLYHYIFVAKSSVHDRFRTLVYTPEGGFVINIYGAQNAQCIWDFVFGNKSCTIICLMYLIFSLLP